MGTSSTFSGIIVDNAVSNLAYGDGNGAVNNVLALTKVGAGTLTLSGSSSYSGPTTINAGTLNVTGVLTGTGTVTVNSGGTLSGTASIPEPVIVASGGAIAPGVSGSGALTLTGSLTLNNGSALNVALGGTATTNQLVLAGGFSSAGVTTVNVSALSGFGEGTYPVIIGATGISSSNFAVGTVPANFYCSLSATNGVLSVAVTQLTLPQAPTGVTATPGNTAVTLNWNATAMAATYNVKRSTTSGTGYVVVASGTGTSFTDTGLTNGTTYYYVVSAVNSLGEGPHSSEVSVTPNLTVPVVMSASSATGTAGNVFSYSINASSSPTSYGATGLPSGLSVNTSNGIISGIPTVTGVFDTTISASNPAGTGTASLSITILPTPPSITSALTATGTNGSAFSYVITATNSPTSFGASGLPAGLSVNGSIGVISGTPTVTGTYNLTISASNAGGSGSATLTVILAPPIPAVPTGLTATGTSAAVVLNWNASANASSYNVKRSVTSGTGYVTILSGVASVSCTDSAVTVGGTYYYVVYAVNSTGESANSAQASATPTVARDFFTQLFASGANNTSNTAFMFTPANNVNGYVVSRTGTTAFPVNPSGGTTLSEGDDTSVAVTLSGTAKVALFSGTYSKFYVGSNGYITFSGSDTSWSTSLATHFSQPRISPLFVDLDVSSGGSISWKQLSDRVAVTWQNVPDYGKTDSNSFQVEMFFDGRIRITLLGIVGTPTSNSDGSIIGLSNGGGQPTGFVSSNFSAYPAPPAIVTGVAAMSGNSTVALIWNAVNGATSYNVKRSLTSGSGYTTIAGGVTATSYSDTGLSNGTTYYYVVSAVNAAVGEGADSAQASATPLAPPAAPTGLVASGSNGFVSLAWNTVINAASYTVKRSVTSGSGYTAVGSAVATTSYTDNSVSNGTTYYYVITAANTSGTSAASAEASARPSAPITVAERSAPSITLSSNGSGGENATTTVKSSVPGHTYQLQHTTDLVNGTWQNVGASKVGDGSDLQLVAPVNSTDARGFFRILIQQ